MEFNELKQRIEMQDDIPFFYKGKDYVILAWYEGGPLLCDCQNEFNNKQFKDAEDFLSHCELDGKNIKDILKFL